MAHEKIQERYQQTYIVPDITSKRVVAFDQFETTLKPDQSSKEERVRGRLGVKKTQLTKDETAVTYSTDAPDFEGVFILSQNALHAFNFHGGDPVSAVGTNAYLWETFMYDGRENPGRTVALLQGDSVRHRQVENVLGSAFKINVSTNGTEKTLKITGDGTGGVLRDPSDGEPDPMQPLNETTAALTMADGATLAGDLANAIAGFIRYASTDVTVTGAGTLGTTAVTVDVEFIGDYALRAMPMPQVAATVTGGTGYVTVEQQQAGDAANNAIYRITIPATVTTGTLIVTLPVPAIELPSVEMDANAVCIYAADAAFGGMAELDRRTLMDQTTAAHTLTGGDTAAAIGGALETLVQGLTNVAGANVTITGGGGPLGTADVTLDVEYVGDFANEEISDVQTGYGLVTVGGTYTGGRITVTRTQEADDTQNEIQRITIPSGVTGDITLTIDLAHTVLLPELASLDYSITDRIANSKFIRCDGKIVGQEGFNDSMTLEHMANDRGMKHLAQVRGNTDDKRVWFKMRVRGPEIAGAVPANYLFEHTWNAIVTKWDDTPFSNGWMLTKYTFNHGVDGNFVAPGVGGVTRTRMVVQQSAFLTV